MWAYTCNRCQPAKVAPRRSLPERYIRQLIAENPPRIGSSDRWRGLYGGRVGRLYAGAHVIDQQHGIRGEVTHLLDDDWVELRVEDSHLRPRTTVNRRP
jgi:hypothetical protein